MAYGKSKYLVKRTQSDKILRDKAFSDPKYDGYQRGLASMVYRILVNNPLRLINLVEVVSLMNQIINWQMSFINQLLKKLRKRESLFIFKRQYLGR